MPEIPGITISILRSQTFGATGQPLQISGRVTVFGVPLPLTFVRVSLTGPDYDPQTLAFDTLADPEGNYAVGVVAPSDGNYTVKADAYLFPLLPQGPLIAQPILLPAIGESDAPPLVFGTPGVNGVIAQTPGGPANLAAPSPSQPEINLNLNIGGGGGGGGGTVVFPGLPAPATPTTPVVSVPTPPSVPNPGGGISPVTVTPPKTTTPSGPTTVTPPPVTPPPVTPPPVVPPPVTPPPVTPPPATVPTAQEALNNIAGLTLPIGTVVPGLGVVSAAPNNPTGTIYNFIKGPNYGGALTNPNTPGVLPPVTPTGILKPGTAGQITLATPATNIIGPPPTVPAPQVVTPPKVVVPAGPTIPITTATPASSIIGPPPTVPAAPVVQPTTIPTPPQITLATPATNIIGPPPAPTAPKVAIPALPTTPTPPKVPAAGLNVKALTSDIVTLINPALGITLSATGVLPKAPASIINTPAAPKINVPAPITPSTHGLTSIPAPPTTTPPKVISLVAPAESYLA